MTDISASRGQASFPPWHQDYIPTADEWLNCFSNKADEASLEVIMQALFPNGVDDDPTAHGSLYDRVSSLENKAAAIALIMSLIPVPVTIIGTTLDDYDGSAFFGREQSRLLAALEQQQRAAHFTQQAARTKQKIYLALKKVGITS